METLIKITFAVIGIIGFVFFLAFINAILITWLWNWLVPILLPSGQLVASITYWQAWGVSFLCVMLFKSHNYNFSKD